MESRAPSGLFPSGPVRPTFREPHQARAGAVWAGVGAAIAWLTMIGVLGTSARGYLWLTIAGALLATVAAVGLARYGDRGVAAGVAIGTGIGLSIATVVVIERWVTTGWPLW